MAEVEAALDAVLAGHALPAPAAPPRTFHRRWVAAAGLAVLAVVAATVLARSGRDRPEPSPLQATVPAASPATSPGPPSRDEATPPPSPSPAATASVAASPSAPPSGRAERPAPVRIELRSTPAGARVTLHGRPLGRTPLSVRLQPDATVLLVFEAPGRLSIAERVRPRTGLVVTAHLPPASAAPGLEDLKASPY
jgi:serine/threonine-protein kinase